VYKKENVAVSAVLLLLTVVLLSLVEAFILGHSLWLTKYWRNITAQTTNGTNRVTQNCCNYLTKYLLIVTF